MFSKQSVTVAAFVVAFVVSKGSTARAQDVTPHKPHFEFIVNSGTIVPTGTQRDAIKRGDVTAAQLAYVIRPSFAITASVGWARTRDVASVGDPKLDMFTYDIGGEVRANQLLAGKTLSFSPFAGVGAGGRSYNYRSLAVDATHNLAAYGSAGGEVGIGRRVKLRIEARDYLTGFKPLDGRVGNETRNDVSVMMGLRLKVR